MAYLSGKLRDWRVWISPAGQVYEITDDKSHAEWVLYNSNLSEITDDHINNYAVDYAFDLALEKGWIRVGIDTHAIEMFVTFLHSTTNAAVVSLIQIIKKTWVETYTADINGDFIHTNNSKRLISRLTSRICVL